jgi:single stranded DNA-binding protein
MQSNITTGQLQKKLQRKRKQPNRKEKLMTDISHTIITGRLVKDPILPNGGSKMAFFALAANRNYKNKEGQWQKETAFLPCKAFGWPAEALVGHKKGDMALCEGRLRTEQWQKEGESQARTELVLVVDTVRFIKVDRPTAVSPAAIGNGGTPPTAVSSKGQPPF